MLQVHRNIAWPATRRGAGVVGPIFPGNGATGGDLDKLELDRCACRHARSDKPAGIVRPEHRAERYVRVRRPVAELVFIPGQINVVAEIGGACIINSECDRNLPCRYVHDLVAGCRFHRLSSP